MSSFIIIGAGLAGLATGYTLAKAGYRVTIIEKESYPGGRVRSLPVDGQMVDFGGFIIFPWYKEYHRLITELGQRRHLRDIPVSTIFYELERGSYTSEEMLSFPIKDMARLYIKTLPKVLRYQMDIANPPLHIFKDQSISEYIQDTLETKQISAYERFADVVCQGYCYGAVTKYKMAVVAPVVLNTTFRGNLKDSSFFVGNNARFAEALAKYITDNGGTIQYNEEVSSLKKNEIITNKSTYKGDYIFCATRIHEKYLEHIAPHISVDCPYTRFYNAVIKCDAIPELNGKRDWGAIFHLPDETKSLQILSSVNIREVLYNKISGQHINLNIVERINNGTLSKQQLSTEIQYDLKHTFPNVNSAEVVEYVHWQETMPVAEESFIERMREIQGNHNIWFAGDYLGSPSMETALRTGIEAAVTVMRKIERDIHA